MRGPVITTPAAEPPTPHPYAIVSVGLVAFVVGAVLGGRDDGPLIPPPPNLALT